MKKIKTRLAWARHYVHKLGFSVLPLKPKNKEPRITWKEYQTRKPTDEELKEWFGKGSKNNIGIVTGAVSQIVVLDFDSQEAYRLAKKKGLPSTAMVKTSRGYHCYFKYRTGIRNFQKRSDLPGIDLRGEGGYVVAPPSVHPSGKKYSWVERQSR